MPGNGIYEFRSLHKPTNLIPFGTQIPLKLSNLIRAGNTQGACDIIDSLYTEYIIQGNIDPFMVHCLVMQILSLIIQISNNVGYQLQEGEVLPQNIRRLFELDIPVEDSNFILHSLCQNLCEYIIEKSNSSKTDLKMRIEEIVALELSNSSFNQVYLAEQLGVTAPYLSSFFKEKMGQNMVDYVNSRRCQLAQYYLSDTDKRISEIAQEVGFIDSAALIRVFKKYYGITPGQYRKNI